jgi:bifunctional enzyme CysN/CysC
LLGIPHLVLAVNKMDLVEWSESVFDSIVSEFSSFAAGLPGDVEVTPIPLSALLGDNVVDLSERMPWYAGPPLLEHLEKVDLGPVESVPARFPVQYVIRPMTEEHHDYRGYAGQLASGVLRVGDEVVVLPSGLRSTVAAIDTADGGLDEAVAPQSVTVRLSDEIDVSRGDMIVPVAATPAPVVSQDLSAIVCWMTEQPLAVGGKYALKHTTRAGRVVVRSLEHRLDVNTLHEVTGVTGLGVNEIGLVTLRSTVPLVFDSYASNRATGAFILVDEVTNATAGAGLIV